MDYSSSSNEKRKKKHRSQTKRVKNKVSVLVFRIVLAVFLIGGFALAGIGIGAYLGILKNAPTLNLMNIQPENYTTFIRDSKTGAEIDRLNGEENRVYVTFDRIPEHLKNAFVSIEDKRFYEHNGVDFRGMGRAVYLLVTSKGETTHGASTVTQQLIKNNLGKTTNDLISKLQEQYLAVQFEERLAEPDMLGSKKAAKDYILEVYMNIISLGRGYYGVQTAAWNYFGKDVSELTLAECASIAAITQNPSKYPPDIRPENNRERQEVVLYEMNQQGYITDAEYEAALAEPIYDNISQGAANTDGTRVVHSYYTDCIINAVSKDLQAQYNITETESYNWIYNKGLEIFSAQDLAIQAVIDEVFMDEENYPAGDFEIDVEYILSVKNNITNKITNYNKKKTVKKWEDVDVFVESVQTELLTANDDILGDKVFTTVQPQAAFVLIDYHTGQVKGIMGGRGEKPVDRSFNRATDATRSPGSQFKVLSNYAPAIDLGLITAASVIDDAPYVYDDGVSPPYTPRNWWGSNFEGLSNIRRGIYRSMNVVAVKSFVQLGIETGFTYLKNFGFTTLVEGESRNGRWLSDKGPSLTLGGMTDGVKQIELASAYGAIANMGEYNKPIFYTKVLDHSGNVLLENKTEPQQVIKKASAYVLIDMMKDTVRVGTATRAAFKNVKMPIAGKTGTSTDTVDLGFTGFTPYYVASVWMGYDQQKMIKDTKNYNHLLIWQKIMERVHENLSEKDFDRPEGITTAVVCRDSGLLPTDLCNRDPRGSRTYTEVFVAGTQPTEYCEVHQELTIDVVTGLRAGHLCPYENTITKVGIVRPVPASADASIDDRAYEFTPEVLYGEECATHYWSGFDGTPWVSDLDLPAATPMPEYPWSDVSSGWWD